jgi:DNA-binding NarL/FixJ family response regulator
MQQAIRVVVFDDNPQRRDGLKLLINAMDNMECVACYNDCRDVVKHIDESEPDVVLMDIDMPIVNGIEGTHQIRQKYPDLKILMQTVFEDDDKVFAAICAGADGYILKQTEPIKMINAITEVLEGGAPMTPVIAHKVLQLFNKENKSSKVNSFNLTQRELDVLQFLAKGYSYKMIAKECNVSYPTVNSHVTSIYAKLKVESVGGAVYKAMKEGLVK